MENCPPAYEEESMPGCVSGFTVTMKLFVALKFGVPLSVATTLTGLTEFACATVGRQVNSPLPAFTAAPDGKPASNEYVSVCAGRSELVAVQGKDRFTPTLMT